MDHEAKDCALCSRDHIHSSKWFKKCASFITDLPLEALIHNYERLLRAMIFTICDSVKFGKLEKKREEKKKRWNMFGIVKSMAMAMAFNVSIWWIELTFECDHWYSCGNTENKSTIRFKPFQTRHTKRIRKKRWNDTKHNASFFYWKKKKNVISFERKSHSFDVDLLIRDSHSDDLLNHFMMSINIIRNENWMPINWNTTINCVDRLFGQSELIHRLYT